MYEEREFDNIDTGETEEDLNNHVDYSQAVLWGTDWTAETITAQLKKSNIILDPKFQRRDAWSRKKKSVFIESLFMGLPIPQIILAESKDKRGKYIVIDGKQRLLSLRQFFADADAEDDYIPLKLTGLEKIKNLNGLNYTKVNEFDSSYIDVLNNQTIRTIVIKNWPDENFLYTVFLRLNTGSLQLSPQELRQALHPGEFIDFVDDFSFQSEEIKKILNIKKSDARMRDNELVIRYFSWKYFASDYSGNLKQFFDQTVKYLNDNWDTEKNVVLSNSEELKHAIHMTIEIFGEENAFSKWKEGQYQKTFNRAIFDIMIYYFSFSEIRTELAEKKEQVKEKFEFLCTHDQEFLSSFETSTKNLRQVNKRFNTWAEALESISGIEISRI